MAKDKDLPVEYEDRIRNIPIGRIEVNPFNPRRKFIESEEDELIESIIEKGILNPIIVYKKKTGKNYVILDGERRLRACRKLSMDEIPAHVLVKEPDTLENLSMMFHIHNVREEWSDFAIALSLNRVVEEMGRDVNGLTRPDLKVLSKLTSLSDYKVKKYLSFLQYPKDVIDRFLVSENREEPEKGVDPDILAEMRRPLYQIQEILPELLDKYPVQRFIEACIQKKAHDTIKTNREFRLLTKALEATKEGRVRKELMTEKLIDFIKRIDVTPEKVFSDTSESIYLLRGILARSELLLDEIQNLDLRQLTQPEKEELKQQLSRLSRLINDKVVR